MKTMENKEDTCILEVRKICCGREAKQLKAVLLSEGAVKDFAFCVNSKRATIKFDPNKASPEGIVELLMSKSFPSKVLEKSLDKEKQEEPQADEITKESSTTGIVSTALLYVDNVCCKREKAEVFAALNSLAGVVG